MGELDKDLCLFWKSVASANITFPTAQIISFEFLEDQLEMYIDAMLGKGKLEELKAIARSHKLAVGSQTVPNSVVEIAAAQEDPPSASTPFVSVGEGPPSTTSIAGAALGVDEGAQISPTPIAEVPASPPHLEAPLAVQAQEGGGENEHQTPPVPPAPASNLPDPFEETLGPFTSQLKTMAEDLPSIVSRAVKDSLKKLQEENSELKESNLMIRAEVEKLTCNLLMTEMEHSRLEDALDAELRNTRKEASDLRQKLHLQLQEKIHLESKLVPLRVKVADLEAARKAEASKVERIEKRSADREILLGKVEADRDKALAELSQAREEAKKIAAELAQTRD
ncbi:uncharacterized protein [Phaseolus vulgaris]|uniref:uncharacterized protein n=1 Tax=Phaseolus vulgaris TaxID=3885 RepID=UPI0035CB9244